MKCGLAALVLLALSCFLVLPKAQAATGEETSQSGSAAENGSTNEEAEVIAGAQGVSLDADENRGGKFELNRQVPEGFVLDYFNWAKWSADNRGYVLVRSSDAMQRDQQLQFRGGWMSKLDVSLSRGRFRQANARGSRR
jgi:hypothetical protein